MSRIGIKLSPLTFIELFFAAGFHAQSQFGVLKIDPA